MNILVIALRILHIVAGILWAGGAAAYYLFIEPTARATAPESQRFMDHLMTRRRFSKFLNSMSLVTILAGAALYYRLVNVDWGWVATGPGIGFTFGALAGVSAVVIWNLLVPSRVAQLGMIASLIHSNGGEASSEQLTALKRIEQEIARAGKLDFALTAIAVLAMATARYWAF